MTLHYLMSSWLLFLMISLNFHRSFANTFYQHSSFLELQNSTVDWNGGFKECGSPMESCTNEQVKPSCLNYMTHPMYCRCDKECIKYGDCCVTVLRELKKIPSEVHWSCIQLPNSVSIPSSK